MKNRERRGGRQKDKRKSRIVSKRTRGGASNLAKGKHEGYDQCIWTNPVEKRQEKGEGGQRVTKRTSGGRNKFWGGECKRRYNIAGGG